MNQHIPSYHSQAVNLLVALDQKVLRNEESQHEGSRKRMNKEQRKGDFLALQFHTKLLSGQHSRCSCGDDAKCVGCNTFSQKPLRIC